MKLKYTLVFLLFVLAIQGRAATNITTPTVTGHWTMAGSPYKIYNDISNWDTLTIDPGVEVIFQGHYQFVVGGKLKALGTAGNRIKFHVADTTGWYDTSTNAGGWRGINFTWTGSAVGYVEYCDFYDMKKNGFFVQQRLVFVKNCDFYHNINMNMSGLSTDVSPIVINGDIHFENCNVHDNWGNMWVVSFGTASFDDTITVKGCNFYNNNIGYTGYSGTTISAIGHKHGAIEQCNIYNNKTGHDGVTMGLDMATIAVRRNKIYNNDNPTLAVITCQNAKLDIDGNMFCNNRLTEPGSCGAIQGGAVFHISGASGDCIIRNNVIANNQSAFQGTALCQINARVQFINNTVVNNNGGAIFTRYGTLTVKNNIFWGNGSQIIWVGTSAAIVYSHNWSESPWNVNMPYTSFVSGDTTNFVGTASGMVAPTLTDDPTESALTSNFALTGASGCINKGDTVANTDTVDYAMLPRIFGPKIDIGAIEYQSVASVPLSTTLTNEMNVYPNPAAGKLFVYTVGATGTLTLYDVTGRVVAQKVVESSVTDFETGVIAPGGYNMVWRSTDGMEAATKVVIK